MDECAVAAQSLVHCYTSIQTLYGQLSIYIYIHVYIRSHNLLNISLENTTATDITHMYVLYTAAYLITDQQYWYFDIIFIR